MKLLSILLLLSLVGCIQGSIPKYKIGQVIKYNIPSYLTLVCTGIGTISEIDSVEGYLIETRTLQNKEHIFCPNFFIYEESILEVIK